jgi:preprotein translocase subunit SecF
MFNLIKYKNLFFAVSGILIVGALISIFIFGFRLGIDFTSGSLWQLKIPGTNITEVQDFFKSDVKVDLSSISYDEVSQSYSLTFKEITDSERQSYFGILKNKFGNGLEDLDFWSISPSVSTELKNQSAAAIVMVVLLISFYVAFAFRKVSRPISSWKYGIITLLTLAHDAIIPAGVLAVLGNYYGITIDTNFIVALLVVVGFSVHDTIVVFDRIRENLLLSRGRESLENIVNKSVNETMRRSINTSLTLITVLVVLFFLGPVSLKYFVLTILVGTIVGTYSSIFIASPLLVVSEKLSRKK